MGGAVGGGGAVLEIAGADFAGAVAGVGVDLGVEGGGGVGEFGDGFVGDFREEDGGGEDVDDSLGAVSDIEVAFGVGGDPMKGAEGFGGRGAGDLGEEGAGGGEFVYDIVGVVDDEEVSGDRVNGESGGRAEATGDFGTGDGAEEFAAGAEDVNAPVDRVGEVDVAGGGVDVNVGDTVTSLIVDWVPSAQERRAAGSADNPATKEVFSTTRGAAREVGGLAVSVDGFYTLRRKAVASRTVDNTILGASEIVERQVAALSAMARLVDPLFREVACGIEDIGGIAGVVYVEIPGGVVEGKAMHAIAFKEVKMPPPSCSPTLT